MVKKLHQIALLFEIILFTLSVGILSYLAQNSFWLLFFIALIVCILLFTTLQVIQTKPILTRITKLEDDEFRLAKRTQQYGILDLYNMQDPVQQHIRNEATREIITQGEVFSLLSLTAASYIDPGIKRHWDYLKPKIEEGAPFRLLQVNKGIAFEKVEKTLRLCTQIGIRTRVSIIIGLPEETADDILSTLYFLLQVQPNEIQLYGLTPHDGTALYGNLSSLGIKILEQDPSLWSRNVLKPVCETDQLSRSQIISLAHKFIQELQNIGYIYLNEEMKQKKIGALKTVATSFSPVQAIGNLKH